jgi:multidrug efflux pump subunit AcrA (membrane-fusion protein)
VASAAAEPSLAAAAPVAPVDRVVKRAGGPVPRTGSSGWGRAGHRRAVLISAVVLIVVLGGGVAAWAEVSGGSAGYRMATVTRADIGTTLTVVGNVDPVSDAAASFQVGGKVTSVTVTPGQKVTAGQTLGTLDTTALSETVSSDQSTLNADEAKLVEDEESQSSAASSSSSPSSSSNSSGTGKSQNPTAGSSTTTTTSPSRPGTGGTGGQSATVTADQTTLTQDEATLSTDQQKEAADLAQAQTDCTATNTSTSAGQATCEAALQTVQADEQRVSKDQEAVSKDETALGQALDAESSGTSPSTTPGSTAGTGDSGSPAQSGQAIDTASYDVTGNTGAGSGNTGSGTGLSGGGANAGGGGGGSQNADTPQQIASDQADIDTAEAELTRAEESLNEATVTSPISGTVVSVGINVGDTVSADSSTEIITIIGTNAYEVQGTLDSSQVPSVKVGQSATVEVDGADGALDGTVSQVGPVQSGDSGYSYPVIVALPSTAGTMFTGSSANVTIATGSVSNVVAVPTSAVETQNTRTYVLELDKGELTRKVIQVGMIGNEYTQVLSGLSPGQSVVLADYAEAVPSTSTNTNEFGGGLGGLGGGGGFFGGGGTFRINRLGGAGGGGFGG